MSQTATPDLLTHELVGRWTLDPQATTVRFRHKTMWGLVTVKGTFTVLEGAGVIAPGGALTGAMTLSAASIDTAQKKRDEHLRSADFLDTDNHPTIDLRFLSGTVIDGKVELSAELTVKGVSEPATLSATITGTTSDSLDLTVEAVIDRDRYGMSWNKLGMMTGLTHVTVEAALTREA